MYSRECLTVEQIEKLRKNIGMHNLSDPTDLLKSACKHSKDTSVIQKDSDGKYSCTICGEKFQLCDFGSEKSESAINDMMDILNNIKTLYHNPLEDLRKPFPVPSLNELVSDERSETYFKSVKDVVDDIVDNLSNLDIYIMIKDDKTGEGKTIYHPNSFSVLGMPLYIERCWKDWNIKFDFVKINTDTGNIVDIIDEWDFLLDDYEKIDFCTNYMVKITASDRIDCTLYGMDYGIHNTINIPFFISNYEKTDNGIKINICSESELKNKYKEIYNKIF